MHDGCDKIDINFIKNIKNIRWIYDGCLKIIF